MKKMIYALVLAVTVTAQAYSQEKASDAAKIFVGFTDGSVEFPVTNRQGVNGSIQFRLYGYEGVKLEAVGDFAAFLPSDYPKVYTYLAGPQVGIDLFEGRFNPFARVMFGIARVNGLSYYTHSVGGGLDINVSKHFGIRPIQYDIQSINSDGQRFQRISAGLYLRFGKGYEVQGKRSKVLP